MSMQFVVEDGSGKVDATSYVSTAEYVQYWKNRGKDYTPVAVAPALPDYSAIQAQLNIATEYIDTNFNFKGRRTKNTEALEWPRVGMAGKDGYPVSSSLIPVDLKNAVCYLAEIATGGLEKVSSGVSSESYGPVSMTYTKGGQVSYPAVDKLLGHYVIAGNKFHRVT